MSVAIPAFSIPRHSVVGEEAEWAKMFDPPAESPPTPELLAPTNPVPAFMEATLNQPGQSTVFTVSIPNTVRRTLLHGLMIPTWENPPAKELMFYAFGDPDLASPLNNGQWPGPTIRVPRGVIFHGETHAQGPPPHTIHWHGIEPTPINDGVGHCSMELGDYTYQWQPNFIGTYFYHCHRNTMQHFEFGLYGMLLIEPPDAFDGPNAGGYPRRTAANLSTLPRNFRNRYPGFVGGDLNAPDFGINDANPHAFTVPYDVEVLWVPDDRDSVWSDLGGDPRATMPAFGAIPGVNDNFNRNPGVNGFAAFNDFNPDYWFVTGVPVPAHRGGTGTIDAAAALPPGGLIPAALNSGVAGMQVEVNARVGETILIRCLDAAYNNIRVTFPVDVAIIAWDGRALGVPPFGFYTAAIALKAGTPITTSVARRYDVLVNSPTPVNSVATVEFLDTRGGALGDQPLVTAEIPFVISP